MKWYLILLIILISGCSDKEEGTPDFGVVLENERMEEQSDTNNEEEIEEINVEDNELAESEEVLGVGRFEVLDPNKKEYILDVENNYLSLPEMKLYNTVEDEYNYLINDNVDFLLSYVDVDEISEEKFNRLNNIIAEYNQQINNVIQNFEDHRRKTYEEFEKYYVDYNEEKRNSLEQENIYCEETSERYSEDRCGALKSYQENIEIGYQGTQEILSELIITINHDQISLLNQYKSDLDKKIREIL